MAGNKQPDPGRWIVVPHKDIARKAEYDREYRANLTDEQLERQRTRSREYMRKKLANRTDDERAQFNARQRERIASDPEHRDRRRTSAREYGRARRKSDPGFARTQYLKNKYGITPGERDELLATQGGVCACCGSPDPRSALGWHIDHDHASDDAPVRVIRGIVCCACNVILAQMGDDIDGVREFRWSVGEHYLSEVAPHTMQRLALIRILAAN